VTDLSIKLANQIIAIMTRKFATAAANVGQATHTAVDKSWLCFAIFFPANADRLHTKTLPSIRSGD
jgi:hypothetical protein